MQSNKFLEKAREIVKRDKELFDSLVEFEKTGKIRTKEKMTFTIDRGVASRFKKYCREHGYSMSAKLEKAMKEILGEK